MWKRSFPRTSWERACPSLNAWLKKIWGLKATWSEVHRQPSIGKCHVSSIYWKSVPWGAGAATHMEELHLRCSYETAWGYNGRNDSWENSRKATLDYKVTPGVSEGAIHQRSCLGSPPLQRHVCCWKLALEKLSTLPQPGAVETEMVAGSCLENHSRTRKRVPFLLQCLSRTLYWQNLTLCQLEKERFYQSLHPSSQNGQLRVD